MTKRKTQQLGDFSFEDAVNTLLDVQARLVKLEANLVAQDETFKNNDLLNRVIALEATSAAQDRTFKKNDLLNRVVALETTKSIRTYK